MLVLTACLDDTPCHDSNDSKIPSILAGRCLTCFLFLGIELVNHPPTWTYPRKGVPTSWSRYQPQICIFPPFSSKHFVKDLASVSQLREPQLLAWYPASLAGLATAFCAGWASAGALLPDPPKRPPMACPMDDPTATPLKLDKDFVSRGSMTQGEYCNRCIPDYVWSRWGKSLRCSRSHLAE